MAGLPGLPGRAGAGRAVQLPPHLPPLPPAQHSAQCWQQGHASSHGGQAGAAGTYMYIVGS